MEKKDQKSRIMRLLAQIVIIMAGLSVYAAGVALFVLPMDMIAAGTTGLGLVAHNALQMLEEMISAFETEFHI